MPCTRCRELFAFCALALLAFHSAACAADSPVKSGEREIAQWIKELGDGEFAVREKASRQLWLAGEVAEATLEKALQNGDLEVRRRARGILDKLRWGIYGDTPAEVVALIQTYQSIDIEDGFDEEIVRKLLDSDIVGLRAVLRLAKNDKISERCNRLREIASPEMCKCLQKVFDKIEDKTRWDWFVTLAYDGACLFPNDFAAYWLLRGQLDDRIRQFRTRLLKDAADKRSAYTLVYLLRAKGDLTEARKIAEKEKFDELLEDLLFKSADWKALAARPKPIGLYPIDQASSRVSLARLSGDRKQLETAVADLKKLAHGQETYMAALTLIANDRPSDGIKLLAEPERDKPFAFIVLCSRLQYREGMALADRTSADDFDWKRLEVLQARRWYLLGEQAKARTLLTRLSEELRQGRGSKWSSQLLGVENDCGLKERALEDCARLLGFPDPQEKWEPDLADYLGEVFPDKRGAVVWFQVLRRKFPKESILVVLRCLRDLLEGKIAKATVEQWIEKAQKDLGSLKVGERSEHLIAFAEIADIAGLDVRARSLLEKTDNYESLMRLGDLLVDKREWTRATEYYRRAWRMDLPVENWLDPEYGVNPLPLYLAGDALVKAGREREGKRLIEQAHLAPLGRAGSRYMFFKELRRRGHQQAALRELTWTVRLAMATSTDYSLASHHLARAAAARKDYFQAAQAYEQTMFSNLQSVQVYFGLVGATTMSSEIHRLRACGLLAAGKHAEANQEIDLALSAWPGNLDVAIALVSELDRRGHKKEADALFHRCVEAHENVSREYPRCASAHNSSAWLSACCRRNLDKALEHARKAVDLVPTYAGYLDTLAEVHFQRGDKDKAILALKHAIELDPKKVYFRKQLKRLEAGDRAAERPSEDED